MASDNIRTEDYKLFNATDIKQFIITQLKDSSDDVFKDVNYIGSNMNTFIDTIAVILQQVLFHLSLNASETAFSTAALYESMNKIVSLLNYKPTGKQTSLLPVQIIVERQSGDSFIIPRFTTITDGSTFVLKDEIKRDFVKQTEDAYEGTMYIDAVMFQGQVQQSQIFTATGDEFEKITLTDENPYGSSNFISDNFFVVYVDESTTGAGDWQEYTETSSLFLYGSEDKKYERRFTEDYGYEFKFGNDVNGKRLKEGSRVVIFYLLSSGIDGVVDASESVNSTEPTAYAGSLYNTIVEGNEIPTNITITIANTGASTDITYPESVESMRNNAPRAFISQNRLFTLNDYQQFITKNFSSYCRGVYTMTNDTYVSTFLRYYYDLGIDSPNDDARLNLSQVLFQTACSFNNVYAVILPSGNTIISDKVPNYLTTAFKEEIVNSVEEYKGLTHNLVVLDPIYRAFTFGSSKLDDEVFNLEQLDNKLVIVKPKKLKYSAKVIKEQVVNVFKTYFDNLEIGEAVNVSTISSQINEIYGVDSFYVEDVNGGREYNLTFYMWNPLYSTDDNKVSQQTESVYPFQFCYFYDLANISDKINIKEEV